MEAIHIEVFNRFMALDNIPVEQITWTYNNMLIAKVCSMKQLKAEKVNEDPTTWHAESNPAS